VAGPGFISSTQFDRSSTCDNPGDYSPGLSFQWIPQGTAQLALTMVDIDIDKVHWIQLIPSTVTGIAQHHLATGGTELRNDFGEATYDGPCPPRGSTHHYVLTLSALPSKYIATAGADPHAAISGIGQLAFATTSLMVTYARS
jgi:Raf kinase inhibitor-like YbhB/YbcL family protein